MKQYPQYPEDWNKAENTLYREFHFRSTPDIECLMRLVKDNLYDKGNEGILRARLLGILRSYFSRANAEFWTRHEYPKTWRIRLFWRNVRRTYHRTFNTKTFRGDVMMCNLAHEVAEEMIAKEQKTNV